MYNGSIDQSEPLTKNKMKKYVVMAAALCALAAVSCKKDPKPEPTPDPQDLTITATVAENTGRYNSFIDTDKIGVFVQSKKANQSNLVYTAKEVGEVADYGQFVINSEVRTSELVAAEDKAQFVTGETTIYAYMPYVEGAAVDAVPVVDLTNQDVINEVSYGKQFITPSWIPQYAKATISEAAPVQMQFVSPCVLVNNGAAADDYYKLPDETSSVAIKGVTVTADGVIAYKNATLDLTSGSFKGEGVKTISFTAKKRNAEVTAKFVVCCDVKTAISYNYTIDVELADGNVYTATGKLVESTIPDAIDWTKDMACVKFVANTAFAKK